MKYSDLHFSYCVRWGDTDTKKYLIKLHLIKRSFFHHSAIAATKRSLVLPGWQYGRGRWNYVFIT